MPEKATSRMARYLARLKKAGLVRVTVYVPADRAEELKALAAKMRKEKDDGPRVR